MKEMCHSPEKGWRQEIKGGRTKRKKKVKDGIRMEGKRTINEKGKIGREEDTSRERNRDRRLKKIKGKTKLGRKMKDENWGKN